MPEALGGARKSKTPYELKFKENKDFTTLCKAPLSLEEVHALRDAIESDYFFEMYVEDLPLWGYLGRTEGEDVLIGPYEDAVHVYLYPHLHFHFGYSGQQIVSANVSTDANFKVDIAHPQQDTEVAFSYSVEWSAEDLSWENRMTRYAQSAFLPSTFEVRGEFLNEMSCIVLFSV